VKSRSKKRWPLWRSLLAIAAGFALGCVPMARLAVAFAGPAAKRRLSGENPGTTSIKRILGKKAAVVVFTGDCLKGFLPATIGRAMGAEPWVVDSLMIAPVAGHVTVVGGKGVATLAGALPAADALAFAMICPIWVGATLNKDHARGVFVAICFYPIARWLLGRSRLRVALSVSAPLALIYARLRGTGWGKSELKARVIWKRLMYDADPTGDSGGSE